MSSEGDVEQTDHACGHNKSNVRVWGRRRESRMCGCNMPGVGREVTNNDVTSIGACATQDRMTYGLHEATASRACDVE